MRILGHEQPGELVTVWQYQLTNSKGQDLTGDGYDVTEHVKLTYSDGVFGSTPKVINSNDIFGRADHGRLRDSVGVPFVPTPGSNGTGILSQTFSVDFQGARYDLSTEFKHVTQIANGKVIQNNVTIVKP